MSKPTTLKMCNKCKRRKPRADFTTVIDPGDGEGPKLGNSQFCEACRATLMTCGNCGIEKPTTEFTSRSLKRGWCKACRYEMRKRGYEHMAEFFRARTPHEIPDGRLFYDQDPYEVDRKSSRLAGRRRRERLKAVPRERVDLLTILQRDGGICGICGQPVDLVEASLDHIVPVSRGGPDTAANLRVTHALCNSRRGHHDVMLRPREPGT